MLAQMSCSCEALLGGDSDEVWAWIMFRLPDACACRDAVVGDLIQFIHNGRNNVLKMQDVSACKKCKAKPGNAEVINFKCDAVDQSPDMSLCKSCGGHNVCKVTEEDGFQDLCFACSHKIFDREPTCLHCKELVKRRRSLLKMIPAASLMQSLSAPTEHW